MKEHPGRSGGLKQTLQAALTAASVLTTPLPAEAAQLKTDISQSVAQVPSRLHGVYSDWEKAKKDPEESKAWLTIHGAFEKADPKGKLDIIKFFATKQNINNGTVITQFIIPDYPNWKVAGPESVPLMRRILTLSPYQAVTNAEVYLNEPWAFEELQKAAKEHPRTAIEKYGTYKKLPGSFGMLRSLLVNPHMPVVESAAYLDTSKDLTPSERTELKKALPPQEKIDCEVAAASQSDHAEESDQFRKEMNTFPAGVFPYEALRPLAEHVGFPAEEANAYRDYYMHQARFLNDKDRVAY